MTNCCQKSQPKTHQSAPLPRLACWDVAHPTCSELKAQAIAHLESYHLKNAPASDELHQQDPKEAELQYTPPLTQVRIFEHVCMKEDMCAQTALTLTLGRIWATVTYKVTA